MKETMSEVVLTHHQKDMDWSRVPPPLLHMDYGQEKQISFYEFVFVQWGFKNSLIK